MQLVRDNNIENVTIEEGRFFVLNAEIPHRPIRGEGTIGLIIESSRRKENTGKLTIKENLILNE